MLRFQRLVGLTFLFGSILLAAGCQPGTGATGKVKGKITVNGQTIKRGLITFISEVGNHDPFSGAIIDSTYETAAIPVGNTKVVITPSADSPPEEGGNDLVPTAKGRGGVTIPQVYQNAQTTPLSFKVEKGENKYDQDLK